MPIDVDHRATLTPHAVAIERAGQMVAKLDGFLETWRTSGPLTEFNRQYKRQRAEAALRGEGYMPFSTAMARLRAALVPMLVGGGRPQAGQSLFAEVFR